MMTIDNWIQIGVCAIPVTGGIVIAILKGYVRSEIKSAIGGLKDEQMKELREDNRHKEDRIEILKDALRDLK